ncbi:hypothetical protein E2I00_018303 [Balaenoptera physalus]|uniref:G-protein coupled receptors family 2 profile 2 domain-containing protein n=1 Tax=Balaenoptera physalus TaxID=9770 RepID=A0A643BMR3_BALPH|nr:hypothetical protein E2I00_018303 [Balaenoptera physalus]
MQRGPLESRPWVRSPLLTAGCLAPTGSIFRNCTQGGWSETFPRPDLACGVHVNDSSNEKRYEYLLKLKVMYTVGYSSSLVMLLVALSVLCAFR